MQHLCLFDWHDLLNGSDSMVFIRRQCLQRKEKQLIVGLKVCMKRKFTQLWHRHTLFNNYFHMFLQIEKISLNHVFPEITAYRAQMLPGWRDFRLFEVLKLCSIDTENVKRCTKRSPSLSYRHLQRFSIINKKTLYYNLIPDMAYFFCKYLARLQPKINLQGKIQAVYQKDKHRWNGSGLQNN